MKRKAQIAWLLACTMVATLFSGIPVSAGYDEEYEDALRKQAEETEEEFAWSDEQPTEARYGLLATYYVPTEWDDEAKCDYLVLDNGFPAEKRDGQLVQIHYNDYTETSYSGVRLWMDYVEEAGGERRHITAEDITSIQYYGNENPREADPEPPKALDETPASVTEDAQFPDQVINFRAEKDGYYAIFCNGDVDIDRGYVVKVGAPDVAFYSVSGNTARENLLLDDLSDSSASVKFSRQASEGTVYMHLNQTESREIATISANSAETEEESFYPLRLQTWSDKGPQEMKGSFEDGVKDGDGKELVRVTSLGNDWYALTVSTSNFPKEVGAFNLELTFAVTDKREEWVEDSENYPEEGGYYESRSDTGTRDYHLGVEFWNMAEGLAARLADENYYVYGDESIGCPISPEQAEIVFYNTSTDENGMVHMDQVTDFDSMKVYSRDENWENNQLVSVSYNSASPKWYKAKVNADEGTVIFSFMRQGDYVVTFDEELNENGAPDHYVRLNAWLDTIDFFSTPYRTEWIGEEEAGEELVTGRIVDFSAQQGKTSGAFYVLCYVDERGEQERDAWAANIDTLEVTAYDKEGNELPGYLEKGDAVTEIRGYVIDDETGEETDEAINVVIGYEYHVTKNAAEDFDIMAIVQRNGTGENEEDFQNSGEGLNIDRAIPVYVDKISALTITQAPSKTSYTEGEKFAPAGMTVKAVYESGEEEVVTDYTVNLTGALKTTDKEVVVTYLGKTAKQTITVKAKKSTGTGSGTGTGIDTTSTDDGKQETGPTPAKKGTDLTDTKTKAEYTVTKSTGTPAVSYEGTTNKKAKTVTVPATVKVNGVTYKVTTIANNAFKSNKKITKVKIGKNITKIGKNAFSGCKNLKTVSVGSNVKTIEASAFKGCTSLKTITLPANTTTIKAGAFAGCKNLKTIVIKSTKLTSKTVSKGAFKGLGKGTTIKVPKKKYAAYKKLFKQKGLSSKVKIVKF